MTDTVIYEVSLEITSKVIGEFDVWLEQHVDAMLQIAGFESAKIFHGAPPAEDKSSRVVVYHVRSQEELQSYFHTHATRMRKAGVERFGGELSTSRRIVPARSYEPPSDLKPLVPTEEDAHAYPRCANCQSPLLGKFCHVCGQEDRTYFLSLWHLLGEFSQEILDHDSKLYRSLFPLLFRPGFLTREYVVGKRMHYVRPVRLYLFVSIIFFFFTSIMTGTAIDEGAIINGNETEAADQPEVRFFDEDDDVFLPDWMKYQLEQSSKRIESDPRQFIKELISNIPIAMFLLLPLFALIMKILYFFSRRYYVEHLVFAIHFHSFVFFALLIQFYLVKTSEHYAQVEKVAEFTGAALTIYVPIYLWLAVKSVYGQGWFVTSLKFFVLMIGYLFAMIPAIVGVVVVSALLY